MSTLQARRILGRWWQAVGLLILVGAGYAGLIASRWDRFLDAVGLNQPEEYTDKDLMQCEAGTHQQGGKCVANPVSVAPQAASQPAAASPNAGSK